MTTFYTQGARLSGMAAFVCAVLAVLAHPAVSRADEITDCQGGCAGLPYPDLMQCMNDCTTFQTQCPGTKDDKGKYTGCASASSCKFGAKAGICGDSPSKTDCTCNPVE